jgi:hypothetical protein
MSYRGGGSGGYGGGARDSSYGGGGYRYVLESPRSDLRIRFPRSH